MFRLTRHSIASKVTAIATRAFSALSRGYLICRGQLVALSVAVLFAALLFAPGVLRPHPHAASGPHGASNSAVGLPDPAVQAGPLEAVVLGFDLDSTLRFGDVVPLFLISGGRIGNPESGCPVRHLHRDPAAVGSGIRICGGATTYSDQNPNGCGYGPIVNFQTDLELTVQALPAFSAEVGKALSYTLTVTNRGSIKVGNIQILTRIFLHTTAPENVVIIGDNDIQFDGCVGNKSGCRFGPLNQNESKVVTVTFTPRLLGRAEASFDAIGYTAPLSSVGLCGPDKIPDTNKFNNEDVRAINFLVPALPRDFALAFDSPVITKETKKVKVRVRIVRKEGYTGSVTVFPPTLGDGITTLTPDPVSTTEDVAVFKFKVPGFVPPGLYPLTFSAVDESGSIFYATVLLKVPEVADQ